MNPLEKILEHIGFTPRPQQQKLYEQLLGADEAGVVVQAGTGTGKSLAVLAAAVHWRRTTGCPSLVVTPTNVLMDQYLGVDAPRVSAALGVNIQSLKGRNRYLCNDAPAFTSLSPAPDWVQAQMGAMSRALVSDEVVEPRDTKWFGCPGSDGHTAEKDGSICHYRFQKAAAQEADIIVTNTHLLIIDRQMKGRESKGEEIPPIFPELGVVLVDECHELENSLREFATRSIPDSTVAGFGLAGWIQTQVVASRGRDGRPEKRRISPDAELVGHLVELRDSEMEEGTIGYKAWLDARNSAKFILDRGIAGAYASSSAVLYIDPAAPNTRQAHKLVSTQIDLSLAAANLLTAQPFGMVSATVPKTLRSALGVPQATFIDVGHPFDYGRQATIGFSDFSGAYRARTPTGTKARIDEIGERVLAAGGGALLLFSSYKAMTEAHDQLWARLTGAGLRVFLQERDSDKMAMGELFKADGNAVLFGTDSFATGFDAPGRALRLVSIWTLPYPGLDPVTLAISDRDRARYDDMMLTKVTQAAGRLIRTNDDVGEVWIADSRARHKILGQSDPMLAHFNQFKVVGPPAYVDESN